LRWPRASRRKSAPPSPPERPADRILKAAWGNARAVLFLGASLRRACPPPLAGRGWEWGSISDHQATPTLDPSPQGGGRRRLIAPRANGAPSPIHNGAPVFCRVVPNRGAF